MEKITKDGTVEELDHAARPKHSLEAPPKRTPGIGPVSRPNRTRPSKALNSMTVLYFQHPKQGARNPWRLSPELMGIFRVPAGGPSPVHIIVSFLVTILVPRRLPYISPQIDLHTLFFHAADQKFGENVGQPGGSPTPPPGASSGQHAAKRAAARVGAPCRLQDPTLPPLRQPIPAQDKRDVAIFVL